MKIVAIVASTALIAMKAGSIVTLWEEGRREGGGASHIVGSCAEEVVMAAQVEEGVFVCYGKLKDL